MHAPEPDSSGAESIRTCEDITQYTGAEGSLEFDLFLDLEAYGRLRLPSVGGTLRWPATWEFQEFEPRAGGTLDFSVGSDTAQVLLSWPPDGLELDYNYQDWMLRLGTIRLVVSGPGSLVLDRTGYDSGGDPGRAQAAAMAGVVCSYQTLPCDEHEPRCTAPQLSRTELALDVPAGGSKRDTLWATELNCGFRGWGIECTSDQPWVRAALVPTSEWGCRIYVTVDASDLETGHHDAWLYVTNWTSRSCARLSVEAIPYVPVHAGSWGQLKLLYHE